MVSCIALKASLMNDMVTTDHARDTVLLQTAFIIFTLCSEKKHPLTFSFISPWIICGFKQKLQWIHTRIDRFWQCKN